MTGFEPKTTGVGSDHSANWATIIVMWMTKVFAQRALQQVNFQSTSTETNPRPALKIFQICDLR